MEDQKFEIENTKSGKIIGQINEWRCIAKKQSAIKEILEKGGKRQ